MADSLADLAECARHEGRTKEAAALYARAVSLARRPEGGYDPKSPEILDGYAAVLRAMGEDVRAAEMEEQAATLRKRGS